MAPVVTSALLAGAFALLPFGAHGFSTAHMPRRSLARVHSAHATARPTVVASAVTDKYEAGTADLPWDDLGFEFRETRSHMRFTWKHGEWNAGELVQGEPYFKMHIASTALHYGQSVFEGLKAFAWSDGSVRIFRPDENAKRIARSGERIMMPALDEATFVDAIRTVVADNRDYVPPCGSGGAMYIRPVLFGSGPRIGLSPADEYTLLIMVMPVGDYYKGGLSPVRATISTEFDRAAPKGVGDVKVAGNYAADLLPNQLVKKQGFPILLYLDAETRTRVEEFSTSNFFGIKADGTYVTPDSSAVLPSITNKSLMRLAEDAGLKVEQRAVPVEELGSFTEVCACGTAVVITPVQSITFGDDEIQISEEVGAVSQQLYDRLRNIQFGEEEDKFGWMVKV